MTVRSNLTPLRIKEGDPEEQVVHPLPPDLQ
jgi:hypothetical protein